MIPAAFDYVRASSVNEALDLLAKHGDDAKRSLSILAGLLTCDRSANRTGRSRSAP
jgi:hypothetical protein